MKLDEITSEILENLSKGLTIKEISQKMSRSAPMIKSRTRQLRIKTQSKNNIELVCWFLNQKIAASAIKEL